MSLLLIFLPLTLLTEIAHNPNQLFDRGLELAREERWEEANQIFLAGWRMAPSDPRFPAELAGVAFKQQNLSRAKGYLHAALRLSPLQPYLLDFLGTVYFLEENLDSCLIYWNRMNKPVVGSVEVRPQSSLDPVFLDRQLEVRPASLLRREELRRTRRQLDATGVFSTTRFVLSAKPLGAFDLTLQGVERKGLNAGFPFSILTLARGLPFQTVFIDAYNLDGRALNWNSLLRWDSEKRRLRSLISGPLGNGPRWRFEVLADLRDEQWRLNPRFTQGETAVFGLQRFEVGGKLRTLLKDRWSWQGGGYLSYRRFQAGEPAARMVSEFQPDPDIFRLIAGSSLEYRSGVEFDWISWPERRLEVDLYGDLSLGRRFGSGGGATGSVSAGLQLDWQPQAQGSDWRVGSRLHAGRRFGSIAFDDLFQLGLERDNPYPLRGHAGTAAGQKGNAPLGTHFLLLNSEISRRIWQLGPLSFHVEPFLDAGRIGDRDHRLGSQGWLWDAGIQTRVRVLESFSVVLSYGRDLRDGDNVYYAYLGSAQK